MSATKYTLIAKFDKTQLKFLSDAKYKLCLSKVVNDTFNVVWQGSTVSMTNTFEWEEEYQVFGAAKFNSGAEVEAETNAVGIAPGQTAILDKSGYMQHAQGPNTGSSFKVDNQWMPCYIGVNQKVNGVFNPIYVDETPTLIGTNKLTPIVTVMLFLSKELKTGTMYSDVQSSVCTVTYKNTDPQTVSYVTDPSRPGDAAMWIRGDPPKVKSLLQKDNSISFRAAALTSGTFSALSPVKYSTKDGIQPLPVAFDAFAVAALVDAFVIKLEGDLTKAAPEKCPVNANMTFDEGDNIAPFMEIIESRNAHGGWPSSFEDIKVGQPIRDGSVVVVQLDTKAESGGPSAPAIRAWDDFCNEFGKFGPSEIVYGPAA